MKRRVFTLIVLTLLVLTVSAQATELRLVNSRPNLSFAGTTVHCSVVCTSTNSDDAIDVTLSLYQGATFVESWNKSGTERVALSGESEAKSGKSYKLVLAYSINGEPQPSISTTKTCP